MSVQCSQYHMVGVAPEACCANVNTYQLIALFSYLFVLRIFLSNRLKVNEFVSWYTGYKPNNVCPTMYVRGFARQVSTVCQRAATGSRFAAIGRNSFVGGLKIAGDVMTKLIERNATFPRRRDRRSRCTLTTSRVFSSRPSKGSVR